MLLDRIPTMNVRKSLTTGFEKEVLKRFGPDKDVNLYKGTYQPEEWIDIEELYKSFIRVTGSHRVIGEMTKALRKAKYLYDSSQIKRMSKKREDNTSYQGTKVRVYAEYVRTGVVTGECEDDDETDAQKFYNSAINGLMSQK